jgi:small subunit ribosomal protein S2
MSKSLYDVPLKELLEAGCHFGHQSRRWNPKMKPYIWQAKEGVHIFDLAKTAAKLKEACVALQELVAAGKVVIFIGTKRQAGEIIKQEATKAGVPYVAQRWLGGTITNWQQIKKSRDKLVEMREKKGKGEYKKYTKKENVLLEREINRLSRFFEGLLELKENPDAIFVVDVKKEIAAVKEARKRGVKVFAMVDYLIPVNDDAVRSIKLIVGTVAQAAAAGKKLQKKEKPAKS